MQVMTAIDVTLQSPYYNLHANLFSSLLSCRWNIRYMTVTQAQPSENWKWFFNGITALLFTGVVIIWWFYGDPTGVLYTRRLAWQVSLCLVLAISLSFINFLLPYRKRVLEGGGD
jgi:hypothetical protein